MAIQANHGETTFHIGDTVRVHYRLIEKEKIAGKAKREVKEEIRERIQIFEGIVIDIHGQGANHSFIVRRIAVGKIGVERIFPLISPWIKSVEVVAKGKARRAKLYYLRDNITRQADKLTENKSPEKKPQKRTRAKPKTHTS